MAEKVTEKEVPKASQETPVVEKVEAKEKTSTSSAPISTSSKANNYAIASLVLGIIGLCGLCMPICCAPFAFLGAIFGYLGYKADSTNSMAKIGLTLSVLGIILAIVMFFISMVFNIVDTSFGYDWNNM